MQVLVVDMIEGFTRSGPLASPRVEALLPTMAEFLASLGSDDSVIFTSDAHTSGCDEFKRFPPHCLKGSAEATLCVELFKAVSSEDVTASDIPKVRIIEKDSNCPFYEYEPVRDMIKKSNLSTLISGGPGMLFGGNHWIVIGCVTDMCIEAAVAGLVFRGKEVTVVRSLIDTWDMTAAEAAKQGLSPAYAHCAEEINEFWFTKRFPARWGANVVERYQDIKA